MKYTYVLNETTITINDEKVTSYGISCLKEKELVCEVCDISIIKENVEQLALLCTNLELNPNQLNDVAEDVIL